MRYDRLFTKLFRTPLLLEANVRSGFEAAFFHHLAGRLPEPPTMAAEKALHREEFANARSRAGVAGLRFEARKQNPANSEKRMAWLYDPGYGEDGRTAVIHVDGVLDRHLSMFEAQCFDATDTNDLLRALAQAENDASTANVLLYFNSPGGSIAGIPECAARITALAQKKNVFAFTDGLCCSAAYWLASGCDQIFASPSASLGSIGVYLALLDESRWLENEGLKVETIKHGKLKGAGASWKPLTDDERAHFQAQVSQIGELFCQAVTAKRPGISTDTMQGQAFFGAAALEAGLIEAILPDIDAAIAQF